MSSSHLVNNELRCEEGGNRTKQHRKAINQRKKSRVVKESRSLYFVKERSREELETKVIKGRPFPTNQVL